LLHEIARRGKTDELRLWAEASVKLVHEQQATGSSAAAEAKPLGRTEKIEGAQLSNSSVPQAPTNSKTLR